MVSSVKNTGQARYEHIRNMAETLARIDDMLPAVFLIELRESNQISCDPPLSEPELLDIAKLYRPNVVAEEGLPMVSVTDRYLPDISGEALAYMYKANCPPRIFRRSGTLARISLDEQLRPYTETLNESAFRGCLARTCNFVRDGGKNGPVPISPPLDVVRDCLSIGDWNFPRLVGVTEAPVMRPDGTIVTTPGYDDQTYLYYRPAQSLDVPPIPNEPTRDDIEASTELLLEPVADFPFDGQASLANALATMATPILRPMIDGPVPLALFDKPQQGTGASLLAEVISIVATGRPAAMMTAQKDDEGWRKAITSLLLKGQTVVTVDNVEFELWAPSLAAVLTATTYQDRILGRSEMVQLPNRTTWLATGNNIRLRGDLPRRCIWVRMDAHTARPWLRDRSKFKHPNLIDWVTQNRGRILWAALTIARGWVVAGRPEPQELPALGGYESYCQTLGGVLDFIGMKGFLGNLNAMYDETDTETPQWEAFAEAWHEALADKGVTTRELLIHLRDSEQFRDALPDSLTDLDKKGWNAKLGYELRKRKDMQFPNGWAFLKVGVSHQAAKWKVGKRVSALSSPQIVSGGEDEGG